MDNSSKKIKDDLHSIAMHEAGHGYAYLLAGLSFDFITIDSVLLNLYTSGHSLGYIFPINNTCCDQTSPISGLLPEAFHECFIADFIIVAGLAAETLHRKGTFSRHSSRSDVKMLNDNPLMNSSGTFKKKYRGFLLAYTFELFKQKEHYSKIQKIADELLKYKTLSYDQVREIVQQQVLK